HGPFLAFGGERAFPLRTQPVVAAFTSRLAALFVRFDQPLVLEAVQHWVEHAFRPLECTAGSVAYGLDDRAAVARAPVAVRGQEGSRGRGHEILAGFGRRPHSSRHRASRY